VLQPSKPTGSAALSAIAWILSATGIGGGLAGCVIPGTSTFAFKPEPIALPPVVEISQPAPSEATEQNSRPAQGVIREAPRRELTVPGTSVLKPQPDTSVAHTSPAIPTPPQPSAPAGQLVVLRVIQRTCVSDAAGNQTCQETEEPSGSSQALSAVHITSGSLQPSTPAVQPVAAEPVGSAASGPERVDINTASADDLNRLGGRFAKAIIARRPYGAVDELVSKRVLTRSTFSQIKDRIMAN
jgi:DNA uptake protein ComE-like DNA-binding protein